MQAVTPEKGRPSFSPRRQSIAISSLVTCVDGQGELLTWPEVSGPDSAPGEARPWRREVKDYRCLAFGPEEGGFLAKAPVGTSFSWVISGPPASSGRGQAGKGQALEPRQ